MDDDVFNINNYPDLLALSREDQCARTNAAYTQQPPATQDSKHVDMVPDDLVDRMLATMQPVPPPAPVIKKDPEKRESRPWLLSTKRTLVKAGIKFYEGLDFTMDRNRNRSVRFSQIYRVFTEVFHNTILPNAIIAERSGVDVQLKDAYEALHYAMRHGKTAETKMHWDDFKKRLPDRDAWVYENVTYPFNFYVKGILQKDGKQTVIPEDNRTTLDEYRKKVIYKFVHLLKPMTYGSTPKLNILVNAFNGDRGIASLSYEELRNRFGVCNETVAAFKKWVKGRRETGRPDADFLVAER